MIYYLPKYEERKLSDKMNALVLEENGKLVWREHELRVAAQAGAILENL